MGLHLVCKDELLQETNTIQYSKAYMQQANAYVKLPLRLNIFLMLNESILVESK